jgi:hypothetical protein
MVATGFAMAIMAMTILMGMAPALFSMLQEWLVRGLISN